MTELAGYPKTASCVCGALTVTVKAAPANVHACCCLACHRRSGSVYTYTAFFAEADASVNGEYRSWRRSSDAGGYHETNFCPACGGAGFSRLEALPRVIGIPAGNFADLDFEMPRKLYWTVHRHRWLAHPDGPAIVERQ